MILNRNSETLQENAQLRSQINEIRLKAQSDLNQCERNLSNSQNDLRLCQVKNETLNEDLKQLESQGNIIGTVQERNRELNQTIVVLQNDNRNL